LSATAPGLPALAPFLFLEMFHNAGASSVTAGFPANISDLLHPLKYEAEKCVAVPGFLRRIYRMSVM
jgi:hypothetical protein